MTERVAYFDNAATTFPKPENVYNFADDFYRNYGGNIGRGANTLAVNAGKIAIRAKANIKELFHCSAKQVVFTATATEALNRILLGLRLKEDANAYITPFEHNAVTRPLNHLAQRQGLRIHEIPFNKTSMLLDPEALEAEFAKCQPDLVVMTHGSNVCGAVTPVLDIARTAKAYDAVTVVDMSQTAGLVDIDLSSELIDFAVFAGHKTLYGPFGTSGFICAANASLKPVYFGGNGINSIEQDMPKDIVQMSEIGSQNVYAIAGLAAATDWILERGVADVMQTERLAFAKLLELLQAYENITLAGEQMECERIGIVSALFEGYSPDEIEGVFNKLGVAVRSGLHCAPYCHRFLGTLPAGTVRFSVSTFTNDEDLATLERALDEITDSL